MDIDLFRIIDTMKEYSNKYNSIYIYIYRHKKTYIISMIDFRMQLLEALEWYKIPL